MVRFANIRKIPPILFGLAATLLLGMALFAQAGTDPESLLYSARNRQDLAALRDAAERSEALARASSKAQDLFAAALARSFEAEVALELGKKPEAASAAQSGIQTARALVDKSPAVAEHHRLLGTLCGQIIPANVLLALQYGRCAREEIDAALRLDPRSALAYVGRGVGNYYLPESFGGGIDKAIQDFRHATSLKPDLADGWLWLGIALRKKGVGAEAKEALRKAKALAPERRWIEQQLLKTP